RRVQYDGLAFHREDLRSEGTPAPVFVHAKLRRRELLRNGDSFRRLGHGAFVPRGNARVKVIRDFDWQVREFLNDVRIEPVAVVQLEKCLEVEALARGRQVGRNLPDRSPPFLERLPVPGLFDLQQLQDVPFVEEEFRIVLPDLIDHERHGVREAVRDIEILQGPESSPNEEAREIALPAVRRDDAVPEEEDQGSRMVADGVEGLQRGDLCNEFLDRDPDALRGPLSYLSDVREALDLQQARDFRILPKDPIVHALGPGRPLQVRKGLAEDGFVRGGG